MFPGVLRYKRMKSCVVLTQNAILLYCPFLFPSIVHFISYLSDHHIQMLKKRKCGSLPYFQFPRCYVLCLRGIYFSFLYFSFLIIWEDLRQLQLVLVIFILQQKNKQRNKNDSILWYKVCCETIHEIALGLLWHQPMGKTCGLRRRNGTMIHTYWKTRL